MNGNDNSVDGIGGETLTISDEGVVERAFDLFCTVSLNTRPNFALSSVGENHADILNRRKRAFVRFDIVIKPAWALSWKRPTPCSAIYGNKRRKRKKRTRRTAILYGSSGRWNIKGTTSPKRSGWMSCKGRKPRGGWDGMGRNKESGKAAPLKRACPLPFPT